MKHKVKYFLVFLLLFMLVCKTYLSKDDFSTKKDLTIIDTIYLSLQTSTSIGFGEIHPRYSERKTSIFDIFFYNFGIYLFYIKN